MHRRTTKCIVMDEPCRFTTNSWDRAVRSTWGGISCHLPAAAPAPRAYYRHSCPWWGTGRRRTWWGIPSTRAAGRFWKWSQGHAGHRKAGTFHWPQCRHWLLAAPSRRARGRRGSPELPWWTLTLVSPESKMRTGSQRSEPSSSTSKEAVPAMPWWLVMPGSLRWDTLLQQQFGRGSRL